MEPPEPKRSVSRLDETYVVDKTPMDLLERGVQACRGGDWKGGVGHLTRLSELQKEPGKLPGRYYSYFGYYKAAYEKRVDEGIKLCRFAVKKEFFHPDNWWLLARTYLLAGKRGAAYGALEKGLSIDSDNADLKALVATMGNRRPPVLSFLSRGNFVNQILGRLRHAMAPKPKAAKKEAPGNKPAPAAKRSSARR